MQARNGSDQEIPVECFSHAAMGDDEDQEDPFQEMDAHQLAEKNSLGEGFYSVRRASEAARLRISSLCLRSLE
jgi:hypothetical protein